jgi:predicted nucleic acid-binding protein
MAERLTHLLDTSVYCQPIKNHASETVLARWSALDDGALCISALCHYEVLQGLMQRASERYWGRYRAILEGRYRILPFDAESARELADLQTVHKQQGVVRSLADLVIAATARRNGLIIATLNGKDFQGLPGVAVEDWSRQRASS